jgi:RNA polymerase sigma factor (sigma-70 family)
VDDQTLVQRAVDGDKEAFAAIYDHYAPRLQAFLWWVLQDGERAADVLFDTFVIAASRLHQLGDPIRLRPWLYAIAAREAVAAQRRAESSAAEGEEAAAGEFIDLVRATAQELTAKERALLDLHFRQGLKDQDLGDALGVKPESAEAIVQRLAERVEHVLGPSLAIRFSQNSCAELMSIVGTAPGPLDRRTRRRAEEHVNRCPTCDEWRRRLGVTKVLAVAPTVPPPAGLRQRVIDEAQLASHEGRPWRRQGFPPPLVSEHGDEKLRRAVIAAAAAVIVAVVLVGAVVLARNDGESERVASVGSTTTSTRPRPASTFVTSLPTTTSTVVPGEAGPGGSGAGGTGVGGGTSGETGGAAGPRAGTSQQNDVITPSSPGTTQAPGPDPDPTPTPEPPPEPPPTTEPPDSEGPSLSGLSISPPVVRGGSGCSNNDSSTATVTVHASDPSGIAQVRAIPAAVGANSVFMSAAGGGTYTATIGPFDVPVPVDELPGAVVVQARDNAGNESAISGSLTVRCVR